MINKEIKVGFLVSYDYELLKNSIPEVYNHADSITLAIDYKRRTWSGNLFNLPESFFNWIEKIDRDKKVTIYEDDFYDSKLTVSENDTRERNMLAKKMGYGGWHIQIDSDEYFVNFKNFCKSVKKINTKKNTIISTEFITIFKKINNNYFLISGKKNFYNICTNNPNYEYMRRIKDIEQEIFLDDIIIHDSWGRTDEEMYLKLSNWSHKNDFDVNQYFKFWQALGEQNYKYYNHFHPFNYNEWKHLIKVKANSIKELINNIDSNLVKEELPIDLAAKQPLFEIIKAKIKNKINYNYI